MKEANKKFQKSNETIHSELPKWKKLIYGSIAFLLPLFILLVIEISLRLFHYGYNLNMFVDIPDERYKEYYSVNPGIGFKYFNKLEATKGTNDIFLKKKPENGFRVFVLGSSTVVGFPYNYNLNFPRMLQFRLQEAYPDKKIEVVNTAITAINSVTLLDFTKGIVKYQPDAILIYTGENEFYGAMGVASNEKITQNKFLLNLHFKLMNLRIYQLMRNAITGTSKIMAGSISSEEKRGTLMKRIVADKDILYGSAKYKMGLEQYRNNMNQLLSITQKKNIPVFYSELICNVRDLPPFGSIQTDTMPGANEIYKQAQLAENAGEYNKAKQLYYKAKDYDCVRFRASEEILQSIRELSLKYNCHLVPMQSIFEQNSPHGLVGNNLLTEHVHPNIDGCFLLADGFYNEIVASKLIGQHPDSLCIHSANYFRRNWGYTLLDSLAGVHLVGHLKSGWPFQPEGKENNYRKLYHPVSRVDSLAFSMILEPNADIEKKHTTLATGYFLNEEYENAYAEYAALICITPFKATYYEQAALTLLKLDDLYTASVYLKKALLFGPSYKGCEMLGDIGMLKHDFEMAIDAFSKALELAAEKEKTSVMYKLYLAYTYAKMNDKASDLAKELRKKKSNVDLNVPALAYNYTDYIPQFVKKEIEEARDLAGKGSYIEAITILQTSIEKRDTPLANRLIGDILLKLKNKNLLFFYQKAYPDFYSDPSFLGNYFLAYYVNRQKEQASKIFEELRKLQPNFPQLPNYKMLLSKMN